MTTPRATSPVLDKWELLAKQEDDLTMQLIVSAKKSIRACLIDDDNKIRAIEEFNQLVWRYLKEGK